MSGGTVRWLSVATTGAAVVTALSLGLGRGAVPLPTRVTPIELRRVPEAGLQPQVVRGADGLLHLVYFRGPAAGGDLLYVSSRDDGQTFSAPLRVNSRPGSAIASGTIRGAQIAMGPDGRVHVAWNGSDSALPRSLTHPKTGRAGAPMLYARSNPRRTAFEPQRNLMTRTYGLDGGGSLGVHRREVFVVWHANPVGESDSEAARRVWLARSSDAGATFTAEQAAWSEPTGACGCCGMQLYAAVDGRLHLLFRSAQAQINRDIYLLTSADRGRTFTGARLHEWDINACPMTSMSIAARGAQLFGAWETDGQVFFGDVTNGAAIEPRAPAGNVAGSQRKHPRLSFSKDGAMLLVWSEGAGWNRGGSLAWQAYDAAGKPMGGPGPGAAVPTWSFGAPTPRADGGFTVFY